MEKKKVLKGTVKGVYSGDYILINKAVKGQPPTDY